MREIVVIGSNGQLGSDLLALCGERGYRTRPLTHAEIEISDVASLDAALACATAPIVINTAARHGAPQLTADDERAHLAVNAEGVANLARWCQDHGAILVHYSTDYVFGAERMRPAPYREDDRPCPVNMYGESKVAGEQLVQDICPAHYVVRSAGLYGRTGSRAKGNSNFVHAMLDRARCGETLRVVTDQTMSPTWTRVIAGKTLDLLAAESDFGLYHMAGSGACTWYEFACAIVQLAGLSAAVEPVAEAPADPGPQGRPRYTALDNARLRQSGLGDLPHWREALATYLRIVQYC